MNNSKLVLLVDDEQDILDYVSLLLLDNGYQIITAKNGQDAYKKAIEDKPDLICLDITMPEESGVKAYRNIKEDERTSSIPVFIITGISSDFKHFIESRKQVPPPDAYFEKPFNKEELLAKLNEFLS